MKITNITGTSFLRKNLNVNQFNNRTYSKLLTSPICDQVSFRSSGESNVDENIITLFARRDMAKLSDLYKKEPEIVVSFLKEPVPQTEEQKEKGIVPTSSNLSTIVRSNKYDIATYRFLSRVVDKNPELFTARDMSFMFFSKNKFHLLETLCRDSLKSQTGEDTRAKIIEALSKKQEVTATKAYSSINDCFLDQGQISLLNELIKMEPVKMAVDVISVLGAAARNGLVFNSLGTEQQQQKIVDILKIVDSDESSLDVTQKLLAIAEKDPDSVYTALMTPSNKTGQLYINSMLEDKNRNYEGVLYYLLASDPERFFDMADKSNCFWFAAGNDKQIYLEIMEDALTVNPEKTLELLSRPYGDIRYNQRAYTNPRSSVVVFSPPAQKCVENNGIDYSELFQACYQVSKPLSFDFFNQKIENSCDEQVNLLTHFVNRNPLYASDLIVHILNTDVLFARSLLSRQKLFEMKETLKR